MTKEELEEKIKNNESVYDKNGEEIDFTEYEKDCGCDCGRFGRNVELQETGVYISVYGDDDYDYFYKFNEIFSTKAEARHYLKNGNVKRTEKLPFVTWEEFNKEPYFEFKSFNGNSIEMFQLDNKLFIYEHCQDLGLNDYYNEEATEENFYKAYETCRKLFLGEKDR